jgi:predicted permease
MRKGSRWTVALRLLPRAFRERFGGELADTIENLAGDARKRGGAMRQAVYITRELWSLIRLSARLRQPMRADRVAGTSEGDRMSTTWLQDVRWALRYGRRRPMLAAAIVFTIALSVAMATTAFGLAAAVLWRPLPFEDAERLVFVWESVERDGQSHPSRVTGARFAAWRDAAAGAASLSLFGATGFTIDTPAGASSVRGVRVSANYFDTLGIRPSLGRTFEAADDVPGHHQVIVLSTAFWRQQFGGRHDVIGETVRLSGQPYTVIGVMPPATYPAWPVNPAEVTLEPDSRQFWVPIQRTPQLDQSGRAHVFGVLARIHGSPTDVLDRLTRAEGIDPHGTRFAPIRQQFVADAQTPLLTLTAAALAVLLIACANLAALQASAFESRRAELSMRLALGAGPARLVRQVFVETLLLMVAGTGIGAVISSIALASLPAEAGNYSLLPTRLPSSVPLLTVPALDGQALAFAMILGLLATAIVSAWPIARLLIDPPSPRGTMQAERGVVYRVLVVSQIAIAVALTSAAGLLGRSLQTIERQDLGFSPERVLVADLGIPQRTSAPDAVGAGAAERQLLDAIVRDPGVEGAAVAYDHPLEANWSENPRVLGDTTAEDQQTQVDLRIVSPGYFEALGVELLGGRTLTDRDDFGAPGVAIINEAFAQQLGTRAIGRRISTATPAMMFTGAPQEFEIVGVVANERFRGLELPAQPAYYLSTRQFPQTGVTLLVRTTRDPLALAPGIRAALRAHDAGITVDRITTIESILGEQLAARRTTAGTIGGFAAGALALAALGMYGLLTVAVGSRRREIGIRLAVGASPASVGRQIIGHALQNAVMGVVLGVALALMTGRLLRGLLFGVSAHDPVLLGFAAAVLLTTAACAAVLPAIRAGRLDPLMVLRSE